MYTTAIAKEVNPDEGYRCFLIEGVMSSKISFCRDWSANIAHRKIFFRRKTLVKIFHKFEWSQCSPYHNDQLLVSLILDSLQPILSRKKIKIVYVKPLLNGDLAVYNAAWCLVTIINAFELLPVEDSFNDPYFRDTLLIDNFNRFSKF